MPRFEKEVVSRQLGATPVVPVFFNADASLTLELIDACYQGGIRLFEYTNRGSEAKDVFPVLVKTVRQKYPDMMLGVGSIVDGRTAGEFISYGADFVVGPLFNIEVSSVCNSCSIPYIPGCGTVTEIGTALRAGSDVVKVFPGEVLGPAFVKAVLGPMPGTKMMVTGGVDITEENLLSWKKAGAYCVGMGSKLFTKELIQKKDWKRISSLCSEALNVMTR